MRTVIANANIITGDGKTVLENRCLYLQDGLIDAVGFVPFPYYDDADLAIDAKGGYVIPGIINQHAHCITPGSSPCCAGAVGVSLTRAQQNLNHHLLQGTTTIMSQDGFVTMDELEEARAVTPMLVQLLTHHLPLHIKDAEIVNFGGVTEKHKQITAEEMIKKGAIGIGEIGGYGLNMDKGVPDTSYIHTLYIPHAIRVETGITVSREDALRLKRFLFDEPSDEKGAADLLEKLGLSKALGRLKAMRARFDEHVRVVVEAHREAATEAGRLGVPLFMHNAPQTKTQVLEFARELKNLFYALHCNFLYNPQEAIEVAKTVRKEGGWVEVITFDAFRGASNLGANHVTTLALLTEGLVDMIGTDYSGGFWDSILRVLQYVVEQRAVNLPQAIALATGNVVKAIPKIAPGRGLIEKGKVADLAIVSKDNISDVRTVFIGGKVVVDEGKII